MSVFQGDKCRSCEEKRVHISMVPNARIVKQNNVHFVRRQYVYMVRTKVSISSEGQMYMLGGPRKKVSIFCRRLKVYVVRRRNVQIHETTPTHSQHILRNKWRMFSLLENKKERQHTFLHRPFVSLRPRGTRQFFRALLAAYHCRLPR